MKILILGGTTEGRRLSYALADRGIPVTVSVASAYGREAQGEDPRIQVRMGRMDEAAMEALFPEFALVVDATHPYAAEVTRTARQAAEQTGVPYLRLLRERSRIPDGALVVPDAPAAAEACRTLSGRILLTTGAKELPAFLSLQADRLYVRLLPSSRNLAQAEEMGIPHSHLIAMEGPFSAELNTALIRQFQIAVLVTKDGGKIGGFPEKAEAAEQTGAKLVVLAGHREDGEDYQTVLKKCEELTAAW